MSETISVHNMFSPGLSLEFSGIELNSMNNLSSYCGLVDAKIRASDKDLPVSSVHWFVMKRKPDDHYTPKSKAPNSYPYGL